MATEVATSFITTEPANLVGGTAVLVGGGGGSGSGTTVGLLAARPATPSVSGERYYASDTSQEFIGVSGAWVELVHGGGGGGAAAAREVVNHTTASVVAGVTVAGSFVLGKKSANFLKISSNRAGYLVLYGSQAARDADAYRPLPPTFDGTRGLGIQAEFAFPAGGAEYIVGPPIVLFSVAAPPATTFWYRWLNGSATNGTTTFSLTLIGIEA